MPDALPRIEPAPPRVAARLPKIGAGLQVLRDPTAFFSRARARYGDTYVVDCFGYRLLCVFSPEGVKNLWAIPEEQASKGLADYALLRHKVPDELFAGRRTRPHDLFRSEDTTSYLAQLECALDDQIGELGHEGTAELFALTRRLGHRLGLACWGGLVGEAARHLDRLIPALDRLDASDSFVHPHRGLWAVVTRKRDAHRAIRSLDDTLCEVIRIHDREGLAGDDLFTRICASWSDEADAATRRIGIARDIVLVHMGSMSNLFAALAWTLVHLLERPDLRAAALVDPDLLDRVIHETIRLRQRSIVLRQVLRPTELADEKTAYHVEPGIFLATMMSVTNTTALADLDRFEPRHYRGPRFERAGELRARELVTTFGHGRHACPAQVFSVAAIRRTVVRLFGEFDLTPRFRSPRPLKRQIGGVARADRACRVTYRRR